MFANHVFNNGLIAEDILKTLTAQCQNPMESWGPELRIGKASAWDVSIQMETISHPACSASDPDP